MKFAVYVKVKTPTHSWEIRQKTIEALNRDDAVHQAEKSLKKNIGDDWKSYTKIMRVEAISGFAS